MKTPKRKNGETKKKHQNNKTKQKKTKQQNQTKQRNKRERHKHTHKNENNNTTRKRGAPTHQTRPKRTQKQKPRGKFRGGKVSAARAASSPRGVSNRKVSKARVRTKGSKYLPNWSKTQNSNNNVLLEASMKLQYWRWMHEEESSSPFRQHQPVHASQLQ